MIRSFKIILFLTFLCIGNLYSQSEYRSPYNIQFSFSRDSLIYDILHTERGDFKNSAKVSYDEWYSPKMLKTNGSWGPNTKNFSYPEYITGKPSQWLRERIIAVAQMFIGYGYQHHHIPDWDPPSNWKWAKTCAGSNGKGVDCSNFTSYVYNFAMGIKLKGDTKAQSKQTSLSGISNGKFKNAVKIPKPASYEDLKNVFQTGDLLFINDNSGNINHVVIWLGETGISPYNVPLVMDSHGAEVKDSNGKLIPCGIQIRPFRENSWYYRSMQFGLRIIE